MNGLPASKVSVGDQLPKLEFGPISRHTLALYCGGSGDHNPIHVDTDFARSAGYDDVFAHGMLSMALMGRMLSNWVPQNQIRKFGVRFTSITHVHDTVHCSGSVVEELIHDGAECLRLELKAETQDGRQTLLGDAIVARA